VTGLILAIYRSLALSVDSAFTVIAVASLVAGGVSSTALLLSRRRGAPDVMTAIMLWVSVPCAMFTATTAFWVATIDAAFHLFFREGSLVMLAAAILLFLVTLLAAIVCSITLSRGDAVAVVGFAKRARLLAVLCIALSALCAIGASAALIQMSAARNAFTG
jgi:hypothetical protein